MEGVESTSNGEAQLLPMADAMQRLGNAYRHQLASVESRLSRVMTTLLFAPNSLPLMRTNSYIDQETILDRNATISVLSAPLWDTNEIGLGKEIQTTSRYAQNYISSRRS